MNTARSCCFSDSKVPKGLRSKERPASRRRSAQPKTLCSSLLFSSHRCHKVHAARDDGGTPSLLGPWFLHWLTVLKHLRRRGAQCCSFSTFLALFVARRLMPAKCPSWERCHLGGVVRERSPTPRNLWETTLRTRIVTHLRRRDASAPRAVIRQEKRQALNKGFENT